MNAKLLITNELSYSNSDFRIFRRVSKGARDMLYGGRGVSDSARDRKCFWIDNVSNRVDIFDGRKALSRNPNISDAVDFQLRAEHLTVRLDSDADESEICIYLLCVLIPNTENLHTFEEVGSFETRDDLFRKYRNILCFSYSLNKLFSRSGLV